VPKASEVLMANVPLFTEVLPRNASGKLLKRELRLTHAGPLA
jgi:acyl-coenzyme A synthetase/AMP-(fatty) acid ligase